MKHASYIRIHIFWKNIRNFPQLLWKSDVISNNFRTMFDAEKAREIQGCRNQLSSHLSDVKRDVIGWQFCWHQPQNVNKTRWLCKPCWKRCFYMFSVVKHGQSVEYELSFIVTLLNYYKVGMSWRTTVSNHGQIFETQCFCPRGFWANAFPSVVLSTMWYHSKLAFGSIHSALVT